LGVISIKLKASSALYPWICMLGLTYWVWRQMMLSAEQCKSRRCMSGDDCIH
jgi:hypothetical protein